MCCNFGQTERGSACPFLFCEHLTGGRRLWRKDAFSGSIPATGIAGKTSATASSQPGKSERSQILAGNGGFQVWHRCARSGFEINFTKRNKYQKCLTPCGRYLYPCLHWDKNQHLKFLANSPHPCEAGCRIGRSRLGRRALRGTFSRCRDLLKLINFGCSAGSGGLSVDPGRNLWVF